MVTLKAALSLDGRLAAQAAAFSQAGSPERPARRFAHRLRLRQRRRFWSVRERSAATIPRLTVRLRRDAVAPRRRVVLSEQPRSRSIGRDLPPDDGSGRPAHPHLHFRRSIDAHAAGSPLAGPGRGRTGVGAEDGKMLDLQNDAPLDLAALGCAIAARRGRRQDLRRLSPTRASHRIEARCSFLTNCPRVNDGGNADACDEPAVARARTAAGGWSGATRSCRSVSDFLLFVGDFRPPAREPRPR